MFLQPSLEVFYLKYVKSIFQFNSIRHANIHVKRIIKNNNQNSVIINNYRLTTDSFNSLY